MLRAAKRAGALIGGAALLGGLTLATAGAANASYDQCPSQYLCAYLGKKGAGSPGKVKGDNKNLLQYNKFNNAESLYNNGASCNVTLWPKVNYGGDGWTLRKGYVSDDLSGTRFWHNVASNKWC